MLSSYCTDDIRNQDTSIDLNRGDLKLELWDFIDLNLDLEVEHWDSIQIRGYTIMLSSTNYMNKICIHLIFIQLLNSSYYPQIKPFEVNTNLLKFCSRGKHFNSIYVALGGKIEYL